MPYRAERVDSAAGHSWLVIDTETFEVHAGVREYVLFLRGGSRSPNTIRAYARAIAVFLTWCERTRTDWRTVRLGDLARFKTSVESSPTPQGRPRSGRSVDLTLTAVCEFLRFAAASGLADGDVAAMLSERRHLTFVPSAFDVGEQGQFRSVRSRALRTRAAPLPPATFTIEQVEALHEAATTARDQFIVRVLSRSGVRVGELLGMRLEHLHFLPDSMPLGCRVPGAHLHVPANGDGMTAARSKSGARTVPVTADVVVDYREYRTERFDLFGDRDQSGHVLINLSGPRAGAPMSYSNLRQILARLGTGLGFRATPHMFRHTAATEWLEAHIAPDVVQQLLGHASQSTLAVYTHPSDAAARAAVDRVHEGRSR